MSEAYEVESIRDHGWDGDALYFQVKWRGFPEEANTWEPCSSFFEGPLVVDYARSHGIDLSGVKWREQHVVEEEEEQEEEEMEVEEEGPMTRDGAVPVVARVPRSAKELFVWAQRNKMQTKGQKWSSALRVSAEEAFAALDAQTLASWEAAARKDAERILQGKRGRAVVCRRCWNPGHVQKTCKQVVVEAVKATADIKPPAPPAAPAPAPPLLPTTPAAPLQHLMIDLTKEDEPGGEQQQQQQQQEPYDVNDEDDDEEEKRQEGREVVVPPSQLPKAPTSFRLFQLAHSTVSYYEMIHMWRKMTLEEKAPWNAKAREEKKRMLVEWGLPEDQAELVLAKKRKRQRRSLEKRRRVEDDVQPHQGPSSSGASESTTTSPSDGFTASESAAGEAYKVNDVLECELLDSGKFVKYYGTLHPVRILEALDDGLYKCHLLAFPQNAPGSVEIFPQEQLHQFRGAQPNERYVAGDAVHFLWCSRKVHNVLVDGRLQSVWVKGEVVSTSEDGSSMLVKHFDWSTRKMSTRRVELAEVRKG